MHAQAHSHHPRSMARMPHREPAGYITTDFSPLAGKSVLALADFENLTFSARQQFSGREPDAARLLATLKRVARAVTPMAFACVSEDGLNVAREYFASAGWKPYLTKQEVIRDCRGTRLLANSDPHIYLHAGALIAASRADAVLVLSGDGCLVTDIARYTASLPKARLVYTCSIHNSTSSRVLADRNPSITANIFIGRDLLVLA